MIAVDLGSNSCRFLEFECATLQIRSEYEAIVKTADGLHVNQIINDAAVSRIIVAISEAVKIMDFTAQPIRAVTTEAMRQAQNRDAVIDTIFAHTGVRFEVIDATREAELTLLAVTHRLEVLRLAGSFVLIDLGGGSTEIIFRYANKTLSRSFALGIVGVAQQCETTSDVKDLLKILLEPLKRYVDEVYEHHGKPEHLVCTAGTPTTIAAYLNGMDYAHYDASKINGYRLTCKGITQGLHELTAMDGHERERYVGVGRASLIVAGIMIVEALYEVLGYTSGIVVDDGLREGVALDYCKDHA